MSKIKIGDNNKIKGSHIGDLYSSPVDSESTKRFTEKHPILISALVSLGIGFIFLFSFWKSIVTWFESLF